MEPVPPYDLTLERLYALLVAIDARTAQIVRDQVVLTERAASIEQDTADILQAWRAGTTLLRVAKILSAIGAGLAAIWAFVQTRFP